MNSPANLQATAVGADARTLYGERERRVSDAIALRQPDRVPIGYSCLRGNVPVSMLIGGTPQEVRDYCHRLIDVVGKGGGFILDAAGGIPQEAKKENVFAMYQAVRDFGRSN